MSSSSIDRTPESEWSVRATEMAFSPLQRIFCKRDAIAAAREHAPTLAGAVQWVYPFAGHRLQTYQYIWQCVGSRGYAQAAPQSFSASFMRSRSAAVRPRAWLTRQ